MRVQMSSVVQSKISLTMSDFYGADANNGNVGSLKNVGSLNKQSATGIKVFIRTLQKEQMPFYGEKQLFYFVMN